jgi:tricorn protease
MSRAYLQFPALSKDFFIFISQDRLWLQKKTDSSPQRLSDVFEGISSPLISPDQEQVAFIYNQCVYTLSIEGGYPSKKGYIGNGHLVRWEKPAEILLSSNLFHPHSCFEMMALCLNTGNLNSLGLGISDFTSYAEAPIDQLESTNRKSVIQRHGYGYLSWKRYQGGAAANLWIDRLGNGEFKPLLSLKHNLMRPFWIDDRIYFISDFEGFGNLYSCTTEGQDLKRHTHHQDFFIRQSQAFEKEIIYSAGGKLFLFDTATQEETSLNVHLQHHGIDEHSLPKAPSTHLTSYALSSKGDRLALTTRGRLFEGLPFKGPFNQKGKTDGTRYRCVRWLYGKQADQEKIMVIADEGIHEVLEAYSARSESLQPCERFTSQDFGLEWGKLLTFEPSPCSNHILCLNHHHQLFLLDLTQRTGKMIASSPIGKIEGFDWSPCGQWVVYASMQKPGLSCVNLYRVADDTTHCIAPALFYHFSPVFDISGNYVYFLSRRLFDVSYDQTRFQVSLAEGIKPFILYLKSDETSVFLKPILAQETPEAEEEKKQETKLDSEAQEQKTDEQKEEAKSPPPTVIDLDNIQERIQEMPVPARSYVRLLSLKQQLWMITESDCGALDVYNYEFEGLKEDLFLGKAESLILSADRTTAAYTSAKRLRVVKTASKPDDSLEGAFQTGGWFDWDRISLTVRPFQEWHHMFQEAWRLQKDLFWTENMGGISWDEVLHRYQEPLSRISCFSEWSSVVGDMHGELGTSHAYIFGKEKGKKSNDLGADLIFDSQHQAYRIQKIISQERWAGAALLQPGLNLAEGDLIWEIAGKRLSPQCLPQDVLKHQKNRIIELVVSDAQGEKKREIIVDLSVVHNDLKDLRYREWVEKNRQYVHKKSEGRLGYLHIPDMSTKGFSEFWRAYIQEHDAEGLVIDVRFNGGGNVSALILDYLSKKRLGYDQSRCHGSIPYPMESPRGPMVALINEYTGSDGDIFSHSFEKLGLGPLIGKRTWGGVVGIWPRYDLMDGTMTSQPEYSFWFHDVGWTIENHGVDPTIEVEISPQDYRKEYDPQLECAIAEALKRVQAAPSSEAPPLPSLCPQPL